MIKNISIRLRGAYTHRAAFGDVVYLPGGSCGPRLQPEYQLVAIHAGDACVSDLTELSPREVRAKAWVG